MKKTTKQSMFQIEIDQRDEDGQIVEGSEVIYQVMANSQQEAACKAINQYYSDMVVNETEVHITILLKTDTVYIL